MTPLEWCSVIFQYMLLFIVGGAFLYILFCQGTVNEFLGGVLVMLLVGIPQNLDSHNNTKSKNNNNR